MRASSSLEFPFLDGKQRQALLGLAGAVLAAFVAGRLAGDGRWRFRWDMLHWTLACFGGAWVCLVAQRHADPGERLRLRWFAAGLGWFALGQLLWDLQALAGRWSFPLPSDFFCLLLGPAIIAGVLSCFRELPPVSRLAACLDLTALAAAALAYSLSFYLPRGGGHGALVVSALAAYPFLFFSALGSLFVGALALRWRLSPALLLLGLSLGVDGWIWMRWNLRVLEGGVVDNPVLTGLFSAVALLQGLACALWRPEKSGGAGTERAYFVVWSALPVMLASGAGLALSVAGDLAPALQPWVRGCSLAILACAVARQGLAVLEREARLRAEERLRAVSETRADAQRLQALGTLAGGVAHEFNNVLMAAMGQLHLAGQGGPEGPESVRLAREAVARGREVAARILEFSRQDPHEEGPPPPLALGPALGEALRLMRPLFPRNVELVQEDLSSGLEARISPTQLQQMLLNFGLNAGQALDGRAGRVQFSVARRDLKGGEWPGLSAGPYAELKVSDNGPGMSEETRHRVFEPFFSTKGPGQGSGLGLSVVHALAARLGGWVGCESELGKGATFTVLLPGVL